MENVVAFNNELSGLYDSKPPISKAKMAAITKAAMRAIKFYKHVVQSVEKFILKCKPEYKVPGLYVIDSIVRQSRHQYGADKDVFAPRFARNIKETFANLFRCAPEDKSRIIRVLNLWQKNSVFAPEVIQPIFDLADPNHPIYQLPPPGSGGTSTDMPGSSNGINNNSMNSSMHASGSGLAGSMTDDKMSTVLPDLSNNNLKQLLNDPNVLRQLQTLQNFQKFKQQEDKQHKHNEMRMQDDAFEKHIQNVLKGSQGGQGQDSNDFNAEVEFVSMEQTIEVINLDGNDSRSPTPDRERYKSSRRRSRTRSRSRDRRGNSRDRRRRSRSTTRSPRATNRRRNSRERERSTRDKERDREHERERRKKGLPDLKKEHLSVCSTTLWVGHLSKLVYQEELSDTFGEFGDIVSIDQIVPRGCAFIVMNRRQDAYKAMQNLKNHKLQGRAITISWAAGKGVKSKEWKDYWDLELGVTYIPWNKLDDNTDFDSLEEGGMFDEDSMPSWMKDKIAHIKSLNDKNNEANAISMQGTPGMMFGIDTTQPPPGPPPAPPSMMPMVPGQFTMAPPMGVPPRPLLGPMGMPMSGIPMPPNLMPGMPPPHPMMVPPGMMPPGFPPPQINIPHLGIPPPNAGQYPGPAGVPPSATLPNAANSSSDDQMDIEIDEDDNNANAMPPNTSSLPPQMNFNQPPPLFSANTLNAPAAGNEPENGVEMFSRDRNRSSSRWGSGGGSGASANSGDDVGDMNAGDRWRENGSGNFNENRNSTGRPLNIPPLDLNNPPLRPDFMNDFDNRAGPRGNAGPGPGPRGGDFFNNMPQNNMPQNRFNQPTSLLQMRIPPPPNMFSPRMGGSGGRGGGGNNNNDGGPMFMRGGMAGGRPQGPGFFNSRNPFSNDGGGRGNARGNNPGGLRGGRGGRNNGPHGGNWSDEDNDDGSFKRRGRSGSRFGDANDELNSNRGGGRRGDWMDRGGGQRGERRDFSGNRNNSRSNNVTGEGRGRGGSIDVGNKNNGGTSSPVSEYAEPRPIRKVHDTEEDWDRELEEYDARMAAQAKNNNNNNKQQQQHNNSENNNNEINNADPKINENIKPNEIANEDASHYQVSSAQEFNNSNNNSHSDESQTTQAFSELRQSNIPNTQSNDIQEEITTTTDEGSNVNPRETNSTTHNNHKNYEEENTQVTSIFEAADTTTESNALEIEGSVPV